MRALRIALGAALLVGVIACLPEFPAEAPEPLPEPDAAEPEPDGAEPEPDGAEPEPDAEPDAAAPEPDLGPQPEACNGNDDDFDGITDEGFALNQPCVDENDLCGFTACNDAGDDTTCQAPPDAPARADELCNGADDDCDGTADEGFDVAVECTVGAGACEVFGLQVCADDGMGTVCGAEPGMGEDEFCNDIDDDCDGMTDEGGVCD